MLLGLRNQCLYKKCINARDKLILTVVIQIALEFYNSDRQLSIILRLSATTAAATTVQNPSVRELHMEKANHSKKGRTTKARSQSTCKSCYWCGAIPSHLKDCLTRDAECYKCRKKGHFNGNCRSKKEEKEMGRTKDARKCRNLQESIS